MSKISDHPEREAIEAKIASGVANRRIASLYGFSEAAVRRYKHKHFGTVAASLSSSPAVKKATAKAVTATVENLSSTERFHQRFSELRGKIDSLLLTAEKQRDGGLQIQAIREARGLLDLESKVVLQILGMKGGNEPITIRWVEE